jgi:uncharacterized lipoprotein YajG
MGKWFPSRPGPGILKEIFMKTLNLTLAALLLAAGPAFAAGTTNTTPKAPSAAVAPAAPAVQAPAKKESSPFMKKKHKREAKVSHSSHRKS